MLSQSDDTLAVDMPCEKPTESRHSVHEILWVCCFFSLFFLSYIYHCGNETNDSAVVMGNIIICHLSSVFC